MSLILFILILCVFYASKNKNLTNVFRVVNIMKVIILSLALLEIKIVFLHITFNFCFVVLCKRKNYEMSWICSKIYIVCWCYWPGSATACAAEWLLRMSRAESAAAATEEGWGTWRWCARCTTLKRSDSDSSVVVTLLTMPMPAVVGQTLRRRMPPCELCVATLTLWLSTLFALLSTLATGLLRTRMTSAPT